MFTGILAHIVYVVVAVATGAFSHRWLAREVIALGQQAKAQAARGMAQMQAAVKK